MENAIRNRRAHFSVLFCSKSDPRLSWRHLRSILGRLIKILSRLGSQLASNLDPEMVLELPKSGPRGAYRSPVGSLGFENGPKATQNLPKPAQAGAEIFLSLDFWLFWELSFLPFPEASRWFKSVQNGSSGVKMLGPIWRNLGFKLSCWSYLMLEKSEK